MYAPLEDAATGPRRGLIASIKMFTAALADHLATRLELFTIEVAEEKSRLVSILVAVLLSAFLAVLSLASIAGFVLLYYWDTPYRLQVAGGIVVVFIAATIVALLTMRIKMKSPSNLFTTSVVELRKDRDLLSSS